ncbi:MAG: hypothetical protein J0M37_13465 [Ignavibacteria bacterium]|nr:hypothetical protein [Ignavibacteria bacterium]
MTIDDDHLYHGAALIQIAEDKHFTAINSMTYKNIIYRSAYRVNTKIGVYFKYASKPHYKHKEYLFTFMSNNLRELEKIRKVTPKLFIALICVKGKQICLISYKELQEMIKIRENTLGKSENQYTVLVNLPKGSSFRAYINYPGQKNTYLGKQLIVSRNDFPKKIFK